MTEIGRMVAFIPIRGGSKSIPLKNIKSLNGRPLVYWVLDAVTRCEGIDTIVVSTDDNRIKEVVGAYSSDKIVVIDRSDEVSTDTASTEAVMLEFANAYSFHDIILVQATSPLLAPEDFLSGLEKYSEDDGIDSVLSVVRQKRFLWEDKGQRSFPVNYDPLHRPRRQEFDGFLVENGAFYITSRERLLATQCRISGNIGTVEMPEETFFEIDEPSDWMIIETLMQISKEKEMRDNLSMKLQNIKCLLTDSDGVLTDGGMYYSETGDELKKFNTKDGKGFQLLREHGYLTGIITGEDVRLVKRRAEKLKVDILYMGVANKIEILHRI